MPYDANFMFYFKHARPGLNYLWRCCRCGHTERLLSDKDPIQHAGLYCAHYRCADCHVLRAPGEPDWDIVREHDAQIPRLPWTQEMHREYTAPRATIVWMPIHWDGPSNSNGQSVVESGPLRPQLLSATHGSPTKKQSHDQHGLGCLLVSSRENGAMCPLVHLSAARDVTERQTEQPAVVCGKEEEEEVPNLRTLLQSAEVLENEQPRLRARDLRPQSETELLGFPMDNFGWFTAGFGCPERSTRTDKTVEREMQVYLRERPWQPTARRDAENAAVSGDAPDLQLSNPTMPLRPRHGGPPLMEGDVV